MAIDSASLTRIVELTLAQYKDELTSGFKTNITLAWTISPNHVDSDSNPRTVHPATRHVIPCGWTTYLNRRNQLGVKTKKQATSHAMPWEFEYH